MSSNNIHAEELSARSDDRHALGIDAKARQHYADPILGAVWVTVDDQIAHVEETQEIKRWVNYTDEYVGWDECRYSTQPLAEWLDEILADATTAEGC